MKRRWFAVSLCAAAGTVRAQNRLHQAYSIGDNPPETVAQLLREIVGPDVRVLPVPNTKRVIVIATEKQQREVKEVIESLTAPRRNISFEVEFIGSGDGGSAEVGGRGGVVIKEGGGTDIGFEGRIDFGKREVSAVTRQTLTVMDGRSGTLRVGESVPYLDWFVAYGRNWHYIESELRWREVGAFLSIEPRIVADRFVQVRVVPELSGLVDGSPHRVRFINAATEVVVADGETIRIGGLDKNEEFYSRFLTGKERGSSLKTIDIRLTPHILSPGKTGVRNIKTQDVIETR